MPTLSGRNSEFAKKLRVYLFWLDIATVSVDTLTKKLLNKSAKEVLDVMDDKVEKGVKEHLHEIAEETTAEENNKSI